MSDDFGLDWLSTLARDATERSEWREYSAFADSRSRGLRSEAFSHLNHFMTTADGWEFEERLRFCRWLLGKGNLSGDLGMAAPQPLLANLLVPTIRDWAEREPKAAEAHLWLGLLRCDVPAEHLAHALALDPACEQARLVLVEWITGAIEYNQHELPGFYINDAREDLSDLDRASDLLAGASTGEAANRLKFKVNELRHRASTWIAAHLLPGNFVKH